MEAVNQFLNRYRLPLAVALVGVVLAISGSISGNFWSTNSKSSPTASSDYNSKSLVSTEDKVLIKVDLAGSVKSPGIYSVPKDARMADLIDLAGGYSNSVDRDYVSKSLNLSQRLSDGQKVYIPAAGENFNITTNGSTIPSSNGGKINVNQASASELDTLSGVGAATAQKIINARPYASIDELVTKKAISKTVLDKIRDQIEAN